MPGIFLGLGIQYYNCQKFLPFKWWRETVYREKCLIIQVVISAILRKHNKEGT